MAFFSFEQLIWSWQNQGVFSVVLPFILIFAVIYGILQRSKILGAKPAIDSIVSLVVAALALQTNLVAEFFTALWPRAGMGLAVLLVIVILFGLFLPEEGGGRMLVIFGSIAAFIVFIIILAHTYEAFAWFSGGFWWQQNQTWIITAIIIVGIITAVILGTKPKGT